MLKPLVTVIISNQNGAPWLERCFASLRQQTLWEQMEVVLVDNCSVDESVAIARKALPGFRCGSVIENPKDLGFTGGNNVGANAAHADLLFFVNNDAWLEPDCVEKICAGLDAAKADAAAPLVLDYDADTFQTFGGAGFDLLGVGISQKFAPQSVEILTAPGAAFLMRAEAFRRVGGFDEGFFMYAEEGDLSYRVWIAGGRIVTIPGAKVHHRGAAGVNPAGYTKIAERRTSETKRYLTNRNTILCFLKNFQHILFLILIPHLLLLGLEAVVSLALVRRWSFVRKSYLAAVADAFRMLGHVRRWRKRIRGFRKRGDFYMLRFVKLVPGRWGELKQILQHGAPKVDAR
jgi:hypothetical protein